MKSDKQSADLVTIGKKITAWYALHGRSLPFRENRSPYFVWVAEIVFQQTRIAQGMCHYLNFIQKFPDVQSLATASPDDVMLAWQGLGYYSRAINLQRAAQQIIEDFGGQFPEKYEDILKLKGVGRYTAAAVSSICFGERRAAIDGNFYRVLSRLFALDIDITASAAYAVFEGFALRMMPEDPGAFNEAIMDLGSEVCTPKNPRCYCCPVQNDCVAYNTGTTDQFPIKKSKVAVRDMELDYQFITNGKDFLATQRDASSIWKNLFQFPSGLAIHNQYFIGKTGIRHKLTHRNLTIHISIYVVPPEYLEKILAGHDTILAIAATNFHEKSFPKPLQQFLTDYFAQSVQTGIGY